MDVTTLDRPTFLCGHPKTNANTYWARKKIGAPRYPRCRECQLAHNRSGYQPQVCLTCGEPLGSTGRTAGYHSRTCEPTTCTCLDGGHPNGLGECGTCHRLVLSCSWHDGRP